MELTMIEKDNQPMAAIIRENQVYTINSINRFCETGWPLVIQDIIENRVIDLLSDWYENTPSGIWESIPSIPFEFVNPADLFQSPRGIWGIGFNYQPEDDSMPKEIPDHPVSFVKPWNTICSVNQSIAIPAHSQETNGEGEIALIIGKKCKNVSLTDAMSFIAGYTTALDMTEAAIHRENPRFLARAKSFDTFCALGTTLQTAHSFSPVNRTIQTKLNNRIISENTTERMLMNFEEIVHYFSKETTLYPGDVILTGTPGPVRIRDGDTLTAEVDGLRTLTKIVVQESEHAAR
ncbi:fumarylacetoacetate hydrolase family protein [Salisediminibacterium beveridgei]|uniref:Fumarylacetoacetate hydrolase family protein n=1 Tax=Salisediminibacterium beveridgei TaxID=632773 RepID=A0A1D7QYF8_9BACI|nr:fumarylacetoacetate hydrolase family protein [Salisediminibacterium beveridgei]AOM84045.1 fumarylacetoacetate hydrolase family protein [Salisediminibacterium beveridgei]